MNKKKIISSLTVAGMLATTATGASVFAADDPATNKIGEYKNVIENTTIVPFVLQSDSDRVTENDIKISYPGATVKLTDAQTTRGYLVTGDVVKINGLDRTIVIYGDVNSDGVVDIFDANDMLANVKGKENAPKLTAAQMEAARLSDRGEMSVFDVNAVLAVAKGKTPAAQMEISKPATETQPEEVANIQNMEVMPVNLKISGTAKDTTQIKVKFDKDASKYTYVVIDNSTGKELDKSAAVDPVNAAITYKAVQYDKDENEALITLKDELSSQAGQTYTLKVTDTNDKVVVNNTFKYVKLIGAQSVQIENVKDSTGTAITNLINVENESSLSMNVKLNVDANAGKSNGDSNTKVIVTLKDTLDREAVGTASLPVGAANVTVSNFSATDVKNLEEGVNKITVTVKVIDGNGNVVETAVGTISKNTDTLEVISYNVTRAANNAGTPTFDIKLKDVAATNYSKIYYVLKDGNNSTAPSSEEVLRGKTLDVFATNEDTDKNKQYKVYFVAVDDALGLKTPVTEIVMSEYKSPVGTITPASVKVSKNTDGQEIAGTFEWADTITKSDVKAYEVTLYTLAADGTTYTPIITKTTTSAETSAKKINLLSEIHDYLKANEDVATQMRTLANNATNNDEIKFAVGVVAVSANSDKSNSPEVKSAYADSYITKSLAAPTLAGTLKNALSQDTDSKEVKLNWTTNTAADGYEILFYKYNADGVRSKVAETNSGNAGRLQNDYNITKAFTELGLGTGKYAVTIRSVADSNNAYIDSEDVPAYTTAGDAQLNVYNVEGPELQIVVEDGKVKGTFSDVKDILNADKANIKYTLYYTTKTEDGEAKYDGTKTTNEVGKIQLKKGTTLQNATVNTVDVTMSVDGTDNTFTLDKLKASTKYYMYVEVSYDNEDNDGLNAKVLTESNEASVQTSKEILTLEDYTVLGAEDNFINTLAKQIKYNGTDLVEIQAAGDSERILSSSQVENYDKIVAIVKALGESRESRTNKTVADTAANTDKITVDSDGKITVIKNIATGTNEVKYGNALKDVDLIIMNASTISADEIKSVTIGHKSAGITDPLATTAVNGLVDLDKVAKLDKVTLTNGGENIIIAPGVKAKTVSKLGSTTKVNDIEITEATTVTATENGLDIAATAGTLTIGYYKDGATIRLLYGTANDAQVTQVGKVTVKYTAADANKNDKKIVLDSNGKAISLDVNEKAIVNIDNVEYTALTITSGKIETSSSIDYKGMTIEPNGYITIDEADQIVGKATITIKGLAKTVALTENPAVVEFSNGESKTVAGKTITADEGTVTYTVTKDSDDTRILTINLTSTTTKATITNAGA